MTTHGVDIQDKRLTGKRYSSHSHPHAQIAIMFQAEDVLLTYTIARELTLDAAQSARSSRGSAKALPVPQIKKLLDSRNEREVLDGLRKVISVRALHNGRLQETCQSPFH